MADIEAALDEFLGQVIEQLRIGRRVAGANVVDRIDDAGAEQVAPHPVDKALGEVLVVLGGEPGGELLAA